MYLVIGDHKTRKLNTLLWSWASGGEQYRDMTSHLVENLGLGSYLYKEDELVGRALLSIQGKYGRDESGRSRLRVMRVTETDVDLVREWGSVPYGAKAGNLLLGSEVGVVRIVGDLISRLLLTFGLDFDAAGSERGASLGLANIDVFSDKSANDSLSSHWREMTPAIIKNLLKYPNPTKEDIADLSWRLTVHPRWVEDLYYLATMDPSIYNTLRKLGCPDENIPAWVKRSL